MMTALDFLGMIYIGYMISKALSNIEEMKKDKKN